MNQRSKIATTKTHKNGIAISSRTAAPNIANMVIAKHINQSQGGQ